MKRILVLAAASAAAAFMLVGCSGGDAESLSIRIEVPAEAIRADGQTGAPIRATVVGAKATEGELVFTSDWPGSDFMVIDDPAFPPPGGSSTSLNLVNGSATAMLYSVRSGRATVQVSYEDNETGKQASAVAAITFGSASDAGAAVAVIDYLGAEPPLVNLKGAGGSEQTTVRFLAKDSQGQPVANAPVTFILSPSVGGASLDPMNGRTDVDGVASTILKAGTSPGTVTVTAVSGTVQSQGDPIAIAGGNVAGENFSFECAHGSIGGFSVDLLEMGCTVYVGDQNKMYKENTSITFLTEAGGVPTTVETTCYDPDGDGTGQGRATMSYTATCAPPMDVAPVTGEPSWPCSFWNRCAQPQRFEERTCNPRDGLVTVVALTTGSEALTKDWNGNHRWDPAGNGLPADEYVDQPEPYVDANDNDQHDSGEAFYDFNGDGDWNPANGRWDQIGPIWKTTKILWTGSPYGPRTTISVEGQPYVNGHQFADSAIVNFDLAIRDINGNVPTAALVEDVVTADCQIGCFAIKERTLYDDKAGSLRLTITDALPKQPGDPFSVEFEYFRTLDANGKSTETGSLGTKTGSFE